MAAAIFAGSFKFAGAVNSGASASSFASSCGMVSMSNTMCFILLFPLLLFSVLGWASVACAPSPKFASITG